MQKIKRLRILAAAAIMLGPCLSAAQAAQVSYNFTLRVEGLAMYESPSYNSRSINAAVLPMTDHVVRIGDLATGSLTYGTDLELLPMTPSVPGETGEYNYYRPSFSEANLRMTYSPQGPTFVSGGELVGDSIQVSNGARAVAGYDALYMSFSDSEGVRGFFIFFGDSTARAFDSGQMPAFLDPTIFDNISIRSAWSRPGPDRTFLFTQWSLVSWAKSEEGSSQVPTPASAALLMLGGLMMIVNKGRRQATNAK